MKEWIHAGVAVDRHPSWLGFATLALAPLGAFGLPTLPTLAAAVVPDGLPTLSAFAAQGDLVDAGGLAVAARGDEEVANLRKRVVAGARNCLSKLLRRGEAPGL